MSTSFQPQSEQAAPDFTRLKFTSAVSLGKTFQGRQRRNDEHFVHYVRAASIQATGLVLDDQKMWMSPEEVDRYQLRRGDVLIVEGGAGYGRSVVLGEDMPGWGYQNHIIRVRPSHGWHGPFLNWAVKAQFAAGYIDIMVDGATIPALSSDKARELPVLHVSIDRQRRIADYLDRETAEIDAMDAELDRLVETLRERRLAVVERVLSPGFEVGGVQPLWSLLVPTKDQGHPGEQVLSVYRDHGVIPKSSRGDNHNRTPADLSSYQLVQRGDVVINKMKAWQGSLGVSAHRGIVSPDYQVCRPLGSQVDSRYLHFVLRSPQMIPQYGVWSKGIRPSQWRLYWEDMATLTVPVPSLEEQRRIVAELDEETAQIYAMIADAERLKGLLAERRSTLITDVVTGKKEVPA